MGELRCRATGPGEPAERPVILRGAGEGLAVRGQLEPALCRPRRRLELELQVAARDGRPRCRTRPGGANRPLTFVTVLGQLHQPERGQPESRRASPRAAPWTPRARASSRSTGRRPVLHGSDSPPRRPSRRRSSSSLASPLACPSSYSYVRTLPATVPLRENWPLRCRRSP